MPVAIGPKFSAQFSFEPKDFTFNQNYDNPKLIRFTNLKNEFTDKFASVGAPTDRVHISDWNFPAASAYIEVNGRYKKMSQRCFPGFLMPFFNLESKRSFFNRLLKEAQKMAALPPITPESPAAEPIEIESTEPMIN